MNEDTQNTSETVTGPSEDDFVGPRRNLSREEQADQRQRQRNSKILGYLFGMFNENGDIVPTTPDGLARLDTETDTAVHRHDRTG